MIVKTDVARKSFAYVKIAYFLRDKKLIKDFDLDIKYNQKTSYPNIDGMTRKSVNEQSSHPLTFL